jgi:hypothetical protein
LPNRSRLAYQAAWQGGRFIFFAPWRLRRLLEQNFTYNPVRFCGATSVRHNIYNRHLFKLKKVHVANPPEMWMEKESALEAVVLPEVF